ncbi:MAG: hypothetical protein WAO58_05045 [Fimbriimonadaceae bacterium]
MRQQPQEQPSVQPTYQENRGVEDAFRGVLDSISRTLFWGGIGGTILGIGLLLYAFITFSRGEAAPAQALANVDIFSKIEVAGLIALLLATTWMWWGEETLGILQLGFGAALYFAPLFVPNIFGGVENEVTKRALEALQLGGQVFGGLAVIVLAADILTRVRQRSLQGSKADQLRYGKGVKEERDIQNVFLGKCWQLPFCRKFVRERCPIYHSRRTCWRERVGCMCEEEVIRGAMENKPIPKDMVMAVKYIPYNNRISANQKAERCRQCVIYNEHQKHKYRLMLPVSIAAFAGVYIMFRDPLLDATATMIRNLDKIVAGATWRQGDTAFVRTGIFEEILLGAFVIVAFAYAMKLLEFLIFKLKV